MRRFVLEAVYYDKRREIIGVYSSMDKTEEVINYCKKKHIRPDYFAITTCHTDEIDF
jgi:hypothetical protein